MPPHTCSQRVSAVFLSLLLIACSFPSCSGFTDQFSFDYEAYSAAKLGVAPQHQYVTSNETSPLLLVNTWHQEKMSTAETHLILRNDGNPHRIRGKSATPLILRTDDLSAVYVDRRFKAVFDARIQQYRGQNYLTFFGGPCLQVGLGNGTSYVYDTSYREVYRVTAQNLSVGADLHEFELTDDGTALISVYERVKRDLTPIRQGKSDGTFFDSLFQEVDLETNELLFQWRASDHVNLNLSTSTLDDGWDYFHLNSVQKSKDGNYLISGRYTNSIYMINGKTGDIMWTLGAGPDNQFEELPAANNITLNSPLLKMRGQHHARFYPGSNETEITFFDNHSLDHSIGCSNNCSRALHIRIDTSGEKYTAQVLREYLHPKGLVSGTQGSVQILENGNVFVGWGGNPSLTEHTPDGECVLEIAFAPWRSEATNHETLDNYRAYRQNWTATPYWDPAVNTTSIGGSVTAFLSWNGATEVRGWALHACDNPEDLQKPSTIVAQLPRAGFETSVHLGYTQAKYLRAAALDLNHKPLRWSGVHVISEHETSALNDLLPDPSSDNKPLKASMREKIITTVRSQSQKPLVWPILGFLFLAAAMAYIIRLRIRSLAFPYRLIRTTEP